MYFVLATNYKTNRASNIVARVIPLDSATCRLNLSLPHPATPLSIWNAAHLVAPASPSLVPRSAIPMPTRQSQPSHHAHSASHSHIISAGSSRSNTPSRSNSADRSRRHEADADADHDSVVFGYARPRASTSTSAVKSGAAGRTKTRTSGTGASIDRPLIDVARSVEGMHVASPAKKSKQHSHQQSNQQQREQELQQQHRQAMADAAAGHALRHARFGASETAIAASASSLASEYPSSSHGLASSASAARISTLLDPREAAAAGGALNYDLADYLTQHPHLNATETAQLQLCCAQLLGLVRARFGTAAEGGVDPLDEAQRRVTLEVEVADLRCAGRMVECGTRGVECALLAKLFQLFTP
jgi:hypothetical protein